MDKNLSDKFYFQIDVLINSLKLGMKITEVFYTIKQIPIVFEERKFGNSKLDLMEIINFIRGILIHVNFIL